MAQEIRRAAKIITLIILKNSSKTQDLLTIARQSNSVTGPHIFGPSRAVWGICPIFGKSKSTRYEEPTCTLVTVTLSTHWLQFITLCLFIRDQNLYVIACSELHWHSSSTQPNLF